MGGLSNKPTPDPHVPQTEGLQIGDHRLSTSCGVVKRPNHQCGDDLVTITMKHSIQKLVHTQFNRNVESFQSKLNWVVIHLPFNWCAPYNMKFEIKMKFQCNCKCLLTQHHISNNI